MPETTLTDEILSSAALQLLRNGCQPQSIVDHVFATLDKALDTHQAKRVVYHPGWKSYEFSQDFKAWMRKHHPKYSDWLEFEDEDIQYDLMDNRELMEVLVDGYARDKGITFEDALSSISQGVLKVKSVPAHRDSIIHEYDGSESVGVATRFAKIKEG
ncbi:hypothetical protein HDV00_003920 [Rhizophlyctis rosea]|nr:hypothetical protein HDV00_003920 [Rhizophlyctis rosea]